jgi:hypothetical protein
MVKSAEEAVSKDNLDRGELAQSKRKMQKKRQYKSRGARGHLLEKVWDLGGFQESWEAHQQELMNFHSRGV